MSIYLIMLTSQKSENTRGARVVIFFNLALMWCHVSRARKQRVNRVLFCLNFWPYRNEHMFEQYLHIRRLLTEGPSTLIPLRSVHQPGADPENSKRGFRDPHPSPNPPPPPPHEWKLHFSSSRHLVNLFNRILDTGKFPTLWSFGLIVPIHKKDDRSKVENYRGITLLSALGKLFTSILNNRLYDYMVQKGILKA